MPDETTLTAPAADPNGADPAKAAGGTPPVSTEGDAPKAEPKVEDPKAGDPAKVEKPAVPEKYELKLPDGSLLKPERLEKIAAFAKERGLSNEQAQAIVERENEAVSEYASLKDQTVEAEVNKWVELSKNDKEFGGPAFKENVELAKRVVNQFGSEEFKKALNETGLGNHPELIRFAHRIGKMMKEDQFVLPGRSQAKAEKSLEELFYGKKSE